MDVITAPGWEATYYQSDTGGRVPVDDPDGRDEVARVDTALAALQARGMLPAGTYDHAAFDRLREAVHGSFEIPWTSITPVMERMLYAMVAILKPKTIVSTGAFCGNTVVWNIGAATGPGQVYEAEAILACEVVAEHVELAAKNLKGIGAQVDVRCQDAHETVQSLDSIGYLYLDATGPNDHPNPRYRGKKIYSSILETAYDRLTPGALIVAHDTVPEWFPRAAPCFFELVRDSGRFPLSTELRIDEQGIEITQR